MYALKASGDSSYYVDIRNKQTGSSNVRKGTEKDSRNNDKKNTKFKQKKKRHCCGYYIFFTA